jgi:hypothetical protein
MEKKHKVHNVIVLDESGSMKSIKGVTIQGFNELVQTIKSIEPEFPEQEHLITFITFNSHEKKVIHFNEPVSTIKELNASSYNPNSGTPLIDAFAFAINKVKVLYTDEEDYNVSVTVLTDGEENASREFTKEDISRLMEELDKDRWTFNYIGTDHDIESMAALLSIRNTQSFDKSADGVHHMFEMEKHAKMQYSHKIRNKESTRDYYKDATGEEEKKD